MSWLSGLTLLDMRDLTFRQQSLRPVVILVAPRRPRTRRRARSPLAYFDNAPLVLFVNYSSLDVGHAALSQSVNSIAHSISGLETQLQVSVSPVGVVPQAEHISISPVPQQVKHIIAPCSSTQPPLPPQSEQVARVRGAAIDPVMPMPQHASKFS